MSHNRRSRHEEKQRRNVEFRNEMKNQLKQLFSTLSVGTTTQYNNDVSGHPSNSNVPNINYNNTQTIQMSPERVEQCVLTLRSIFPDCEPEFIRDCLENETNDHLHNVAERLLTTPYPKVIPETPLTPYTTPTHLELDEFLFDDAPPSYEESLEQQSPPLPVRHQRNSPLIARSQESQAQPSRDTTNPTCAVVKTFLSIFKQSTI
ncbi:12_t:CDS:1 [Funneliformis geosporum]|uniref:4502_t:CDS:1 n=1 Tax=Funneliformis geosporum TaxID=1117311 RepID=A0A9W4WRH2_9GLOM|nr:4502_t:CDS:1 [Funneliformis geosporum]CAI2176803.1 12_t:CDS:1 [Funneliformis geosporum]